MAVKIRLQRLGAKSKPNYKIVAIDGRKRRNGMPLEVLGFYDPNNSSKDFINKEAVENWIKKGAVLSRTANGIFNRLKKS